MVFCAAFCFLLSFLIRTTEECPEAIFIMCFQSIYGVMIQAFMVSISEPWEFLADSSFIIFLFSLALSLCSFNHLSLLTTACRFFFLLRLAWILSYLIFIYFLRELTRFNITHDPLDSLSSFHKFLTATTQLFLVAGRNCLCQNDTSKESNANSPLLEVRCYLST